MVRLRHIETDDKLSLRGQKLEEAIEEDTQLGLIPFFVSFISCHHNLLKIPFNGQCNASNEEKKPHDFDV